MNNRLERCKVSESAALRDGMEALERGAVGIALIVAPDGRLVGTLTDGDIRRALLRGVALDAPLSPHMHRDYTFVSPAAGRAEVLDLMQARKFSQIPVVNAAGQLTGLHLLRELMGGGERPNWAVVMAGGRGTRLLPITRDIPKPMIPVAGRPILERIVLHLVGHGIRRIFLSIHYLGHLIEEHFGDGSRFGCRIEYLREEQPLGTGGALALLPQHPEHPLFVMNGDLVTQADLGAMLEFHHAGAYCATVGLREYAHTVPFGCVDMEGDRITRLEEKPMLVRLINAGMYVFDARLLGRIPPAQEFPITSLIEDAVERGDPVGGYQIADDWVDVGRHEQLRLAREGRT